MNINVRLEPDVNNFFVILLTGWGMSSGLDEFKSPGPMALVE